MKNKIKSNDRMWCAREKIFFYIFRIREKREKRYTVRHATGKKMEKRVKMNKINNLKK